VPKSRDSTHKTVKNTTGLEMVRAFIDYEYIFRRLASLKYLGSPPEGALRYGASSVPTKFLWRRRLNAIASNFEIEYGYTKLTTALRINKLSGLDPGEGYSSSNYSVNAA